MVRKRKSYYFVDKIDQPFKTLEDIKYYIENTLKPSQYEALFVEKFNGKNERINVYYISVSKNGKVTFK